MSQRPNGISIGSDVFVWLQNMGDRQTDRPRYSVYVHAMRPNSNNKNKYANKKKLSKYI